MSDWRDHRGGPRPVPAAQIVETIDNLGERWVGPAGEWDGDDDEFDCWAWGDDPDVERSGCAIVLYRVAETVKPLVREMVAAE